MREAEARAEPADARGRVLLGERVGDVVAAAQPGVVDLVGNSNQIVGRTKETVGRVLQREHDARPLGRTEQAGEALEQHGARVLRGRRGERMTAAGDHDVEPRLQRARQLDPGLDLAQGELAELRVRADDVQVAEARVDREAAQARARQAAGEGAAVVGPERGRVQVRRRRRQLDVGEPVRGEVGQRLVERAVVQVAEGRAGERERHAAARAGTTAAAGVRGRSGT